jgi:hypothetical protein
MIDLAFRWNFHQEKRLLISFLTSMKSKGAQAEELFLQGQHLMDLVMTFSHVSLPKIQHR